MSKNYALVRGNKMVVVSTLAKSRKVGSVQIPPTLWLGGEPLWLPNLELSTNASKAWTTQSINVAIERQCLLALLPNGWVTSILALG